MRFFQNVKKYWKRSFAAIISVVVILGISYKAGGWAAIPSGIVAWGTILLAVAAFLLIKHSNTQSENDREENKRLREEERAENKRLREEDREHMSKKFAMDKIYDFAKQLNKFTFSQEHPKNISDIINQNDRILLFKLMLLEVTQYSRVFDKRLESSLQQSKDDLDKYWDCLNNVSNQIIGPAISWSGKRITAKESLANISTRSLIDDARRAAWTSANSLLSAVIALKMKLKV